MAHQKPQHSLLLASAHRPPGSKAGDLVALSVAPDISEAARQPLIEAAAEIARLRLLLAGALPYVHAHLEAQRMLRATMPAPAGAPGARALFDRCEAELGPALSCGPRPL